MTIICGLFTSYEKGMYYIIFTKPLFGFKKYMSLTIQMYSHHILTKKIDIMSDTLENSQELAVKNIEYTGITVEEIKQEYEKKI